MESYFRGDTIEMSFQLYRDKSENEYWDLTGAQIRFELRNGAKKIKKGSVLVTGGSDEQIQIINAAQGSFIVYITKDESIELAVGTYQFEIEVTTSEGKRYTVLQDKLSIKEHYITWQNVE